MGWPSGKYFKSNTYGTKYPHLKDNKILCVKCLKYKRSKFFLKNTEGVKFRKGFDRRCNKCRNLEYKIHRAANLKRLSKLSNVLLTRLLAAKDRSQRAGTKFELTLPLLKKMWRSQDGYCAISGIKMTHLVGRGRQPTNVSVDRIDSAKGYSRTNTQLVCMAVNQMKSDMSRSELIYFCKHIATRWRHT